MQRYFINEPFNGQKQITIVGEPAHHITKVMRMKKGDRIVVVNDGTAYVCSILSVGQEVVAEQTGETVPSTEMPVQVDIACGLPKGDKLEFIAQKGTELGMHALIPFVAERSIAKWDEKKSGRKIERLSKIAQEAAEQSQRTFVPLISPPLSFRQLLESFSSYDAVFVADEEEAKGKRTRFAEQLKKVYDSESKSILFIFGPEGGISRKEIEAMKEHGAMPVALGPRILRAETAPLYVLSAISYEFE
ncbi:16S rRNA (uracil(1498)-N(3))-methyltransferase [Ureibacillus sp. FSL K6-8385]|uniref:Ribosomal RNA small subunit methyltransferase E n=1 Tax=Ureibacillus terrenus TaxID=118246 RepID=A0A540V4V6_9BACL|nr:16S rRNA (uracil(1498)-N(3))-methyltransferase [Ureibacillus terrenus]MED3661516.1 16S rRNA (uracil(1498)-N(3))-methyltransferase [Ureibacillus terrenus]MED3763983.1 16S rRNA (uracil(1498)-N(3))-methyltransferase [Ureibacillus terrenus]TQE91796.1 16S rRNA (uracil(1498)-N(3))-methyltransferase [Ureibacillus terrenus]